ANVTPRNSSNADSTGTPQTDSASSTARRIELIAESRFTISPLRKPFRSPRPEARNFKFSSTISPMSHHVFVLPISNPTMYLSFFDKPPPPENFLLQFLLASIRAPQPELSGFSTICRVNCKSTECTQPAFACHCEKFSTSIRYFDVKSPAPNLIF